MTVHEDGDWWLPSLTVSPFDGTTLAVLEKESPSGVITAVTVSTADSGATWLATTAYMFTAPGEWIDRWTVTGMGESKATFVMLVQPDPAAAPSGSIIYATTTDYAKSGAALFTGVRRALREASGKIDEMLLAAVYPVDASGYPTETKTITALRDATVAQAEYAKLTSDTNSIGNNMFAMVEIGSAKLTRGSTGQGFSIPGFWSPKAFTILQRAGLTAFGPQTR